MFLRKATPQPLLALAFAAASLFAAPSYASDANTLLNFAQKKIQDARDYIEIESGEAWRDPSTGLIWKRCSLGQTWNRQTCVGQAKKYNFEQAQEAVKALGNGWRVPAASELASLVRCNTGFKKTRLVPDRRGGMKRMHDECNDGATHPTIDTTIFPNTPDWSYWSASPTANYDGYAWLVYFDGGGTFNVNKSNRLYVRAVRASQ